MLCWAGQKKVVGDKVFYSRVDIELINEQLRLFYSTLDEVKIEFNKQSFIITEYVFLRINDVFDYYPLEKTIINFKENGKHDIVTELLFKPPQFDKLVLHHIFNNCNTILQKLKKNIPLTESEKIDLLELPTNYMICVFNEIPTAFLKLKESKQHLKTLEDKTSYIKYKEAVRVLRKVNY